MPSIIPGYEYDIFISYRHKDNKYDGWVSEFVNNLKKEIAATFKEDLSIYFDENPQDGLLESQHVDKSLEGKLRCLVFIPILSQTYCDPNSFAWKNEFCAFNKLATSDQFGMYVRLANGNVNSRILPVRIHELEAQDKLALEKELGGVLRAIDFIYRTPGVNRPLRANEDEPKENLNHIFYRDQINKVANTIKSTVAGIRMGSPSEKITPNSIKRSDEKPPVFSKKRILYTTLLLLAVLAGIFITTKFTNQVNDAAPVDRSIAVLPFVDLSPNKDQEYFSDGLSEELLNVLARIPDLKVISRTSAFSFKGKNEDVRSIGKKLGVANILEGSVRKSDNKIRITAQLIRVSDGSHIWSKTYDRTMDDVFKTQDEIAHAVVAQLKISLAANDVPVASTNSDAYNLYLKGKYFFSKRSHENVEQAIEYFKEAIDLEANNAAYWAALSLAYTSQANNNASEGYEKAREAAEKAIYLDQNLATGFYARATIKAIHDWDWAGADTDFQKAYALDPANFGTINGMANLAFTLGRVEEAIALYKKALDLDPLRIPIKINLGMTLMHAGKYTEAMETFKSAAEMNAQFPTVHYRLGLCYLLQGNREAAIAEIEKETVEDWKMQGLALAYYNDTQKASADSLLTNFIKAYQDVSAFQIAEIYAYRNEIDQAFVWLEKAYSVRDGGLTTLIDNPWLAKIESDPRYVPFLKKMKLSVTD